MQTAHEAGQANHGVPDPLHLAWAEVHQRGFVTGDWDFLLYGYSVRPHHSVILIPRRIDIGQAIRHLELLAAGYEPEEMTNCVVVFSAT